MVMDTIRMNQGHAGQCSIIDEESSVNTTKCFDFLKDSDELLQDSCTNHIKLSAVTQVFNIKSDHGLSEAVYDKIVE